MTQKMNSEQEHLKRPYESAESEIEPFENESTEIAKILSEGDPDIQLAVLERKAALASRYNQAMNTILLSHTYPDDWKEFDGKMCLISAGAERVARWFGIKFYEVKNRREDFTDATGKGYRYVFEGKAAMSDRLIYAQGVYSTRDKFLGSVGGDFRPTEDINENHVRNAAYHIFQGNAIKSMLGLRAIPVAEFRKIMASAGQDASKAGAVRHGSGTQGGTSAEDSEQQKELGELLLNLANACKGIVVENGKYELVEVSEISEPMDVAKESCRSLTTFTTREGKVVNGVDSLKTLRGKRLEIALNNAREIAKGAGL